MAAAQIELDFTVLPPAARRTDPDSSKDAAWEMDWSGARGKQMGQVYELLSRLPGRTSLELAQHSGLDRYQIARRLADLEHAGLVAKGAKRQCAVGNRPAMEWWLVRER
jgi:predicted HTH transcriptional regulator